MKMIKPKLYSRLAGTKKLSQILNVLKDFHDEEELQRQVARGDFDFIIEQHKELNANLIVNELWRVIND